MPEVLDAETDILFDNELPPKIEDDARVSEEDLQGRLQKIIDVQDRLIELGALDENEATRVKAAIAEVKATRQQKMTFLEEQLQRALERAELSQAS